IGAEALEEPQLVEGTEDLAQRRVVVGLTGGRRHPDDGDQGDRDRDLQDGSQGAAAHACVSRCEGCQCRARRSTRANRLLSPQPSRPVVVIRAYITSTLPPWRASLMVRPSPVDPTISSAVTARIRA